MVAVIISVILSGISLSMDAFAVSICNGMVYRDLNKRKALSMPLTYGLFQAIMPIIGFYVGLAFLSYIEAYDHWIAFVLLLFIGGKMVFDGIKELRAPEEEITPKRYSFPEVFIQGIATSIDALAVGFSLNAMLNIPEIVNVQAWAWLCVCLIGVITFIITLVGVIIGIKVGKLFRKKACVAEIVGGLVLVAIGIKILVEGLL